MKSIDQVKQQGSTQPTAAKNGNKTQINADTVVKAINELYSENDHEAGTMYTVREILAHLGVDVVDGEYNEFTDKAIKSARAFVKAVNTIHESPNEHLGDTAYYDVFRRTISENEPDYVDSDAFSEPNYFNWYFGLLKAGQIGDAIEASGFEGRTSHEVHNRLNSDRWGNYLPIEQLSDAQQAKIEKLSNEQGN